MHRAWFHTLAVLFFPMLSALWALSASAAGAADRAPPLPVEAFFKNPALSGAALSPSGRLVALRVGAAGSRDRLAVLDLSTMKVQPVASFDDADVTDFHWVNDGRLVFQLGDSRLAAADRAFAPGLYAVNADGSGYKQLVQREHVSVGDNIGVCDNGGRRERGEFAVRVKRGDHLGTPGRGDGGDKKRGGEFAQRFHQSVQ